MSNQLRVDFDAMEETIRVYGAQVTQFREAKDSVQKALDDLKASGWDSTASNKWYSMLDESWIQSIRDHMRVIGEMKVELGEARDAYEALLEERRQLAKKL